MDCPVFLRFLVPLLFNQFVNAPATEKKTPRWLNRTVLGIGLASLLSDWSHEIATTVAARSSCSAACASAENTLPSYDPALSVGGPRCPKGLPRRRHSGISR